MIEAMPIFMANEDGTFFPARTTSSASLVVLSIERLPDQITTLLGMPPDRWRLAGEFGAHPQDPWRSSRPNPFNLWELESQLPEDAPPDAHLADLLDRIGAAADLVAALVADPTIHSVRLWLQHHSDNENPGFSLNAALMRRIDRLGTGLEVDVYAADDATGGESP